jgi:hypothetical protein
LNADATNYNAAANTDDGSCLFLVTLSVDMAETGVSELGIHVAGSFQGWDAGSTAATQVGGSGSVYELQIALSNGDYEFKFVNGNAWGADESVNGTCGAGNGNRLITVADTSLDNGTPCFGSCDACAPVVVMGCTYAAASNYNAAANDDDGSCAGFGADCEGDLNNDGTIGVGDLLSFLGIFGTDCD